MSQGYRATTTRQFTFYHSFSGVPGTQLIDLRRMKGWVDLRANQRLHVIIFKTKRNNFRHSFEFNMFLYTFVLT